MRNFCACRKPPSAREMSESRCQPTTGGFPRRRASNSLGDGRLAAATPPLCFAATLAYNRRASGATNYLDRLNATLRQQSSQRAAPPRKTPANPPAGRTEQQPVKQLAGRGPTGNRKLPRQPPSKRPPFVVGTGNTTTYRGGGGGTTRAESRGRPGARERRAVAGSVAKDAGTESKTGKSERPPEVRGNATMTLVSGNDARAPPRDGDDTPPGVTAVIVDDPLPELYLRRADRKPSHPSGDVCMKQVRDVHTLALSFQA